MPRNGIRRVRRAGLSPRVTVAALAGSVAVGALLVLPAAKRASDAKAAWETTRRSPGTTVPPVAEDAVLEAMPDSPGEATRFLAQIADTARRSGCRLTHWENIPSPERDPRATLVTSRIRAETLGDWAATAEFVRRIETGRRRVVWVRCEVVRTDDRSRTLLGRWEMERYVVRKPPDSASNPPTDVALAAGLPSEPGRSSPGSRASAPSR